MTNYQKMMLAGIAIAGILLYKKSQASQIRNNTPNPATAWKVGGATNQNASNNPVAPMANPDYSTGDNINGNW